MSDFVRRPDGEAWETTASLVQRLRSMAEWHDAEGLYAKATALREAADRLELVDRAR